MTIELERRILYAETALVELQIAFDQITEPLNPATSKGWYWRLTKMSKRAMDIRDRCQAPQPKPAAPRQLDDELPDFK